MLFDSYDDLYEALQNGIVEFEYEEKDGTTKVAHGTLDPYIIADIKGKRPDQCIIGENKSNWRLTNYFDTDANAVRSFYDYNLHLTPLKPIHHDWD